MAGRSKAKTHPMMPIWRKRIGDWVREKRGDEKQEAFADRVKISRSQMGMIENGRRSYTIDPLIQILAGLDTDPVKILLSMAKDLNSLDPGIIEACRLLMLLSDDERRIVSGLARNLVERSGQKLRPEE